MEELTIEVFQAQFGSSDYQVLQRFEGIRGVKHVKIYGSVTGFPRYVEWLTHTMMLGEGEKGMPYMDDDEIRKYDLWTVSQKWEGAKLWADWCLQQSGR